MILSNNYNPDVLTCLANLSNDEVFTPPQVVNQMLDMLPPELFRSPETRFLDPVSKSGVFLREIAKRLMKGLEDQIPDIHERANHIFTQQLNGIAITELTSLISRRSLYCSKWANGKYSLCTAFTDEQGNLRYRPIEHKFVSGKCKYCGASQSVFGKAVRTELESHAYEFIHTDKPEKIFGNMKFDVIIGNPPYQLEDGGNGKSSVPIYHLFVEQAKKLNPRYLCMIIPSRWFTGGRGLNDFRSKMLTDKHIRILVDYENFKDVFPGVDLAGGACYFLRERDSEGKCKVVNRTTQTSDEEERYLDEFDVFVRSNKALSIVRKVRETHLGQFMDSTVSPSKPFGLRTFYEPKESGIPCQFIQKIGLKYADEADVTDNYNLLNKWKFLAPRSPIAGQTDFSRPVGFYYDGNTRIVPPGTCCTESLIVLFASDKKEEVESFKSYLYTKVVRFLLLQCVVSQDVIREKYKFVPYLEHYDRIYTDEYLCELWNIDETEWEYIDSKILRSEDMGR
ncbi:MAG: Eco57I restriction-modification methylase domain-containing protein [Bacteroidaceae bacterium]|nr:Eco57I restriction-modification methylase domain-containing protein [Bacteroidaceae bacterium]